jgi:hypothetical protein
MQGPQNLLIFYKRNLRGKKMRTLIKIPRRYLLLAVVATILLLSVIGIAATRRASATTPADCAGDCRDNRDKWLTKCDEMPEGARDKCKERVN